jgi:hypothetical protein
MADVGDIINACRIRVGINPVAKTTAAVTADKHAMLCMGLMNNVMNEIAGAGQWPQLCSTAYVCVKTSSTYCYVTSESLPIQNIYEVALSGVRRPLDPVKFSTYLQYSRGGECNHPRKWTIVGVTGTSKNPKIGLWPTPATAFADRLHITYYTKRPIYTTQVSADIPWPQPLVEEGLYAQLLTEEAGGGESKESKSAQMSFKVMLQEELNRYDADSGDGQDTQMAVTGIN